MAHTATHVATHTTTHTLHTLQHTLQHTHDEWAHCNTCCNAHRNTYPTHTATHTATHTHDAWAHVLGILSVMITADMTLLMSTLLTETFLHCIELNISNVYFVIKVHFSDRNVITLHWVQHYSCQRHWQKHNYNAVSSTLFVSISLWISTSLTEILWLCTEFNMIHVHFIIKVNFTDRNIMTLDWVKHYWCPLRY